MASKESDIEFEWDTSSSFLCELCHHKCVTVRCLDCKRFLCPECRISHLEIPACMYHLIEDIQVYKSRHKQNLHDVVEGYITLVCECEQNSRDLSRYGESVKAMKRTILDKIQDSAFQMHDHVTKYHQSLCELVENFTSEELREIESRLIQLQKTCSQIVGKTNIITSVLDNNDTKTITDELFISEIQSDYFNDCPIYGDKLVHLKVPSVLLNMRFKGLDDFQSVVEDLKLLVQESGDDKTTDCFTEINIPVASGISHPAAEIRTTSSDTENSRLYQSAESSDKKYNTDKRALDPYPKKIKDLVNNPLDVQMVTEYEGIVRRLAVVNNEVWTIMNDGGITVISTENGETKRKVKIKERNPDPSWWSKLLNDNMDCVYECLMITRGCHGDIICLGKTQDARNEISELETHILMVDSEGDVQNKMASSSFIDISSDEILLYALIAGKPNKVDIFKSDGAKGSSYLHMRTVCLEIGRTYYRLLASAGVFYVTGLRHEIHKYHIETVHRYTHGTYGSRLAGELDTPKLCCVDDYGLILVADCQNHRLQLLDREKQWHILEVSGMKCPWDADWDCLTGQLWFVASRTSGTNTLFKIKTQPKAIVLPTLSDKD